MTEPTPIFDRVILDYGHGGMVKGVYQTRGKRYTFTDHDGFTLYEGVFNRGVAMRLSRLLLDTGITVLDCVARKPILSPDHKVEQRDIGLRDRITFVNAFPGRGTLLCSLHGNAVGKTLEGPSRSARGVSIWTSKGQTRSDPVASSVYSAYKESEGITIPVRRGDWSDGDPDNEADFYVLRKSRCSAFLPESGFFTNIDDARFMASDEGQQAIAQACFDGMLPWLKVRG